VVILLHYQITLLTVTNPLVCALCLWPQAMLALILVIPVLLALRVGALVLMTLRRRQRHQVRLAVARSSKSAPPAPAQPLRAMAVLGSGGHTSELIAVLSGVQRYASMTLDILLV
jgi:hypothetical protein